MEIIRIHDLPDGHVCKPSVMAVGNFDGIHIGHQQLIGKAKEIAALSGLPASVLTFYPHPRQVLGKGSYANLLTPFDEKMRVLRELGVQIVYVVDFTMEFAAQTAEEFVHRFLAALNPQTVVVGFDYAFGRGGQSGCFAAEKAGGASWHLRGDRGRGEPLWGESFLDADP
ncbi:MAG: adenylyltransferase/cytidyltransferase family protein [Tumebacillaceae bacterium]